MERMHISQKSLLRCQCANTESVLRTVLAHPLNLFFGRTAQLTESYTVYTVYYVELLAPFNILGFAQFLLMKMQLVCTQFGPSGEF